LVPLDQGATVSHGRVILVGLNGDEASDADLTWHWEATGGANDQARVEASIRGPSAPSALIFAGPAADALQGCTVNGETADADQGTPDMQFNVSQDVESLDVYPKEKLKVLSLTTNTGIESPYVVCRVGEGLSSADPPEHRLYVPELVAFVDGVRSTLSDETTPICVSQKTDDSPFEQACSGVASRAWLSDTTLSVTRDDEQWRRDFRLLLLGGLLGLGAQALWEALGLAIAYIGPQRQTHPLKKPALDKTSGVPRDGHT
jgi:hypothetical protein